MHRLYDPVTQDLLMSTLVEKSAAALVVIDEEGASPAWGDISTVERALRHRALTGALMEDLNKIDFGFENTSAREDGPFEWHAQLKGLMGARRLGDLAMIGCLSGGDGETAVYYVVYHDGSELRGYVPTDGNSHDPSTRKAAQSNRTARRFDAEALKADIMRRIQRRPGSADAPAEPQATPTPSLHPAFADLIASKDRRTYTRKEAQKLLDQLYDPTFMKPSERIDIARLDNVQVGNLMLGTGVVLATEFAGVVDDPEGPPPVVEAEDEKADAHPDAVRLALDEVQTGIADRLSGLIEHAALHGIGLRLIDGRLCAFNLEALGHGENEAKVARHYRELGGEVEIAVIHAERPDPVHDSVKNETEDKPDDVMAPLRAIVDQARAVLTKRKLSTADLDDHQIVVAALKFNSLSPRVKDDLSRVDFGLSDVIASPTSRVPSSLDVAQILGERGLPEGRVFIGMMGAAKNEAPLYFVLWHDGTETRAYVPGDGNMYDRAFDAALPAGRHSVSFDIGAIVNDLRTHFINI